MADATLSDTVMPDELKDLNVDDLMICFGSIPFYERLGLEPNRFSVSLLSSPFIICYPVAQKPDCFLEFKQHERSSLVFINKECSIKKMDEEAKQYEDLYNSLIGDSKDTNIIDNMGLCSENKCIDVKPSHMFSHFQGFVPSEYFMATLQHNVSHDITLDELVPHVQSTNDTCDSGTNKSLDQLINDIYLGGMDDCAIISSAESSLSDEEVPVDDKARDLSARIKNFLSNVTAPSQLLDKLHLNTISTTSDKDPEYKSPDTSDNSIQRKLQREKSRNIRNEIRKKRHGYSKQENNLIREIPFDSKETEHTTKPTGPKKYTKQIQGTNKNLRRNKEQLPPNSEIGQTQESSSSWKPEEKLNEKLKNLVDINAVNEELSSKIQKIAVVTNLKKQKKLKKSVKKKQKSSSESDDDLEELEAKSDFNLKHRCQ